MSLDAEKVFDKVKLVLLFHSFFTTVVLESLLFIGEQLYITYPRPQLPPTGHITMFHPGERDQTRMNTVTHIISIFHRNTGRCNIRELEYQRYLSLPTGAQN